MAEFPYPEYRNLWRGSKLSEDRSALSTNAWSDGGKQVDDGLEVTITSESAGSQSPACTNGAYRVDVVAGESYSLAVPVRNSGAVQFPVRMTAYFDPSGWETSGIHWISPGETTVIKIENMVAPNDGTIRFSWRVDADDPRLPVGGKLTLLDGITLTPTATAPDFPFNGDGAKPVEEVSRANVAPPLPQWFGSGATNTDAGGGWFRVEATDTTGYISTPGPYATRVPATPGGDFAQMIELRVPAGSPAVDVETASFLYSSSGSELTPNRTSGGRITVEPGETRTVSLDFPVPAMASGARMVFYLRSAGAVEVKSPYVGPSGRPFDGDTAPAGGFHYRWAPDGTSLEVETIQPPEGRTYVWDGEPYESASTAWVGPASGVTGVFDVGISTAARLGLVTDVYSRSREKIKLRLALPDRQLIAGERVELAASAQTASAVTWRWRQITGPTVDLEPKQNTLDFIAPDVDRDTTVRIGVYAGSEDGRNRSDWHYFDLTIQKALARYQEPATGVYRPVSPKFVGYERGPREIWNDVIPPNTFVENPKYEQEIIDLGIVPDDVEFSTAPPARASRGAVYVDPVTGDVYRNFGDGYNETDDTTAAPRKNAYMVNPATGDISKWIED